MTGRALRGTGLATVAVVLAGACGREEGASPREPPAVVVGPENVVVLEPEVLRRGPPVSGTLSAEREATVRAEVGGPVLQVLAERGQPVSRGQVLARIDDTALRGAYRAAQSALRSASVAAETARRDVERTSRLAEAGAVAVRDLDAAHNTRAAARAQLADARARLTEAQEQLGKTVVRAPISGVVSERPVNAGDVVTAGAALVTVVDPRSMELAAAVPAARLEQLRVGAPVRFVVSGYPGRVFEGRVRRISPAADSATGQVPLYVTIPNPAGALVAGLFAEGRVVAEERRALLVPPSAVVREGDAETALRLRGGIAERVPVRLGDTDSESERVEVVAGLAAGDTVLVGAAAGTTPGTRVRVGGATR